VDILPKVKMKTSMAGLDFSLVPGDQIEVRDDIAKAWVDADIAELVEEEKPNKKTPLKKGEE
jgi:hypothetical protein